ncbi:MAG: MazG nucleotide pyrophosphohydrolase [Chloroflexi bacterium]|nr:MazG nucleotide pyrophosphohydrolase [Chloroflexota bacterium]
MWDMQTRVAEFDADRFRSLGPGYVALSLAGEVGELANEIKKIWRADPAIGLPGGFAAVPSEYLPRITDEIADVLLLSIVLSNHLGIDVERALLDKLAVIDQRLREGHYGAEATS